jgi:hypothetical protein
MLGRRIATAFLALACALVAAGCGGDEPEPAKPKVVVVQEKPDAPPAQDQAPKPPPAGAAPKKEREPGNSILHAPGDYMRTVTVTVPRRAKRDINTATVGHEIQQFNALEGRYPMSLKELEQWRGSPLPACPHGYAYKYDSNTGELSVQPIN